MHALDKNTGEILWQSIGDASFAPTSAIPGVVFVGSVGGFLRAFDAATGAMLTGVPVGFAVASAPVVVDGIVIVGAGIGERTGNPQDPAEISSRIPQNITALCVPGTHYCP